MAKKESKALNKKEKNSKDKKSFFKSFKGELKKVSWPTPKQLVNNTIAVIVIVVVIAVIVFVLDLAFDAVNKYGIDKIKEAVVSTSDETENTVHSETGARLRYRCRLRTAQSETGEAEMRYYQKSDIGKLRANNQDSCGIYINNNGYLLAMVSDGIGGLKAGEIASSMAIEYMSKPFLKKTFK